MKTRYRYTKKELAKDLGMTGKRLTKELIILEPELLKRFPTYSRNCQILNPHIYKFILEQLGAFEPEDVRQIMQPKRANFGCQ